MIEKIRARFEASDRLRQFVPMLDEIAFAPRRLEWLATAPEEHVFDYCNSIDD